MEFSIKSLFSNHVINVSMIAWFLAQFIKFFVVRLTSKKFDFRRFIGSGGMPSSHSSFVCSATAAVLFTNGFSSPLFAISLCISLIVMYDAAGVRRAAGEQAKVLNKMLSDWKTSTADQKTADLKELLGHTKKEVFVGMILGIAVAIVYFGIID